ncbi:type I secretion system permease/ATPase [bacterium AH-315-E07]|nr:type I secretion system permease/ATPase [bacterium AH-315-E07]
MAVSKTSKKHLNDKSSGVGLLNQHLRTVIKSTRRSLTAVFFFSFVINMLMLAIPLYLLQIYDKVITSRSTDTLFFLTGVVLVVLVAYGFLDALRRGTLAKLGAWFEKQVGEHLLGSAITRSLRKSVVSVDILRDLARIRNFLSGSSLIPILDCPWTPVYILILFLLHPLIGWFALVGAVFLLTLAYVNERFTRQIVADSDDASRESLDTASAYVKNADVINAMGMQPQILSRWAEKNDDALELSFNAGKRGAIFSSIAKVTRFLLQIGVIFLAAWLILLGQLTPGAMIASVLLLRQAISPMEQSIRSWKSVVKVRTAFANVSRYLDYAPTLREKLSMPTPSKRWRLSVEDVGYRHSSTSSSIFSRINLIVHPGEAVALVGPTAAGKTTLARILVGIAKPTSGRVTLGGYDFRHWASEDLGPYIGYLPQDVELFAGTIRENIARLQEGDINSVIEAATLANVNEVIQALPQGYETEIGDGGMYLSGGQRQRIGLARTVYGNPKIIVLDEPDASLDDEGKAALASAIQKLKARGAIIILVSHHASIRKVVDRVLELKDGRISIRTTRNVEESSGNSIVAKVTGRRA